MKRLMFFVTGCSALAVGMGACQKKPASSTGQLNVTKKTPAEEQQEAAISAISGGIVTQEQERVIREEIEKIVFSQKSQPVEVANTIVDRVVAIGKELGLTKEQLTQLTQRLHAALLPLAEEQSREVGIEVDETTLVLKLLQQTVSAVSGGGLDFSEVVAFISGFISEHKMQGKLSSNQLKEMVCTHFEQSCRELETSELQNIFNELAAGNSVAVEEILSETSGRLSAISSIDPREFLPFQSAFLASGAELPDCTEERENQLVFNSALKVFQHCQDSTWQDLDLDDLVSSSGDEEVITATAFVGDGSGLTNLPAQNPTLGGDLSGTASAATVTSVGGETAANIVAAVGIANSSTASNTAGAVVRRDSLGSFSAGTVTATAFVGDGSGLTNLPSQNPTLGGDLSGTANAATVTSVGGETAANIAAAAGVANSSTASNTAGTVVRRDSLGNFSAGTVTATAFVGDGSGLANLPSQNPTLGGDLSGAASAATVTSVGGETAANIAAAAGLANNAVSTNTSDRIVRRNAGGGFSAGTINATAFVGDGSGLTAVPIIAVRDTARRLRVISADSSNVYTASRVRITADEVILQDSAGYPYRITNVVEEVDLTASAAGGLDTGVETSDTWYYVWLISDGVNVDGLISTSSTSPTLPSGYTRFALVSVFRNDSSGDIEGYTQNNRKVRYWNVRDVLNDAVPPSAYTALDLSGWVPPDATVGQIIFQCENLQSGGGGVHCYVSSRDSSGWAAYGTSTYWTSNPTYLSNTVVSTDIHFVTAQTMYYGRTQPRARFDLGVQGFEF